MLVLMTPRARAILFCTLLLLGGCGDPDCRTDGCATGEVCDDVTRLCAPPPDTPNCAETGCDGDLFCDVGTGACIERSRCLSPEGDCADGNCTTCPPGLVCDASSGFCQPAEACRFVACPVAQQCNPQSLACQPIVCRLDPDCPAGSICTLAGTCLAGCRNDAGCNAASVCTIPPDAEAGSCTARCAADVDCPWGERCAAADGIARCEAEGPCSHTRDCRDGEECRGETCLRPLCSDDEGCDAGEYCLEDTGECASADCTDDAFEPNSEDAPWPLARGRYEGLTICRGKADWYSINSRGTQPLRLTLSHGRETDLDMQVFQDELLVGEATNDGALSIVEIPAAIRGELRIRIFPARGVSATYQLFVENGRAGCQEDVSEPNDRPEQAARLRPGIPAVFSTCSQDTDFLALGGEAGAARLTLVPLGEPVASWETHLTSDATGATAVPVLETGVRELRLAWINPASSPLLRSTSRVEMRWNVEYEVTPARCEDPVRGNRTAERAVPVAADSVVQGAICPDAESDLGTEADWFQVVLPDDEQLQLTVELTSQTDRLYPAAPLSLALFSGSQPRPWRTGASIDGRTTAVVQLSGADRPVYARVTSSEAYPDLLSSWPAYDLAVRTQPVDRCIQDRSEGNGNDSLEDATPLDAPVQAVLCPADVDTYLVDGDFVPGRLRLGEVAVDAAFLDSDGGILAEQTLTGPTEQGLEVPDGARYLRVHRGQPADTPVRYDLLAP